VLIAFGIVVIVLAVMANNTVKTDLKQQQITGGPLTWSAISDEVTKTGLKNVTIPSCHVAGKPMAPMPGASPGQLTFMRSSRPTATSTRKWASTNPNRCAEDAAPALRFDAGDEL
jgi:hypothetical protein